MPALSRERLLEWLDTRQFGLVASAVCQGLAVQIRRGDFDEEEVEGDGENPHDQA